MVLKERYKTQLIAIISKYLPDSTIYLFGSRATGKCSPGSDIDIALDADKKIPFKIITKILVDIDDTTIPLKVDIVDLQSVSEDFKKIVLKEGIKWKN